ncbi:hypothetical protein LC653_15370 [Nostoc sp. CHAB 5784]|uniref:hypothetical protein n=1 Tax=Nostoc mirabile TaxID=2907820 RepID=UPI001E3F192B|nr:hypothetical protein [Nostoc mirabile]MCC5665259.1 hypothetical protein [Nostoc mirabile CHAB5784]
MRARRAIVQREPTSHSNVRLNGDRILELIHGEAAKTCSSGSFSRIRAVWLSLSPNLGSGRRKVLA